MTNELKQETGRAYDTGRGSAPYTLCNHIIINDVR